MAHQARGGAGAGAGVRVVYYDHASPDAQPGFRSGEAGRVLLHPDGEIESDVQVWLTPNSVHALEGHRVLDALNALPLAVGPIAPGRDAVLRPVALDSAARILNEADRKTYGAVHEFVAGWHATPEAVEYRIVIDNREYQRTLARLHYLVTRSGREGHGVRLRIAHAAPAGPLRR